ncbi:MAG: amidohydrolase family protein, partial [Pseudomonadota bacterium]|nr:amidohydrolase family protein [Pseudomonadota bacterium]
ADKSLPPTSDEVVTAWSPWLEFCIELFGHKRAMFESNFPVDKISCSYHTLWNSFKVLTADYSADEKTKLYHDNSARVYRL